MEDFIEYMKKTFTEWKTKGCCSAAKKLNASIEDDYFDTANPHFFTGDLKAKIVLVQLNPKREKEDYNKKCEYKTFEDYCNFYSNFGKIKYIKEKEYKSKFDNKQLCFLRAFSEELGFDNKKDKTHDLALSIDKKLQLELVPFGSPNFDSHKIKQSEQLKNSVEQILNLLVSHKRDYVIFCSKVFETLLEPYFISPIEKIKDDYLKKSDGTKTKNKYSVSKGQIKFGNKTISVFIAPQFACQNLPEI